MDVMIDTVRHLVAGIFTLIGVVSFVAGALYCFSGCYGLLADAWRQLPQGIKHWLKRKPCE